MIKLNTLWRWWAKALGQKAIENDREADNVACIRTFIFFTYLITNLFIVAGVLRHWNDKQTINIEIHETPNYSETIQAVRWNNLGMDRNSRIDGVYHSAKIQNRTGEFE